MTIKEVQLVIDTLKKEGHSDEAIQRSLAKIYFDGLITLDELNGLINVLGYHIEDEFLNMSKEEQFEWYLRDIKNQEDLICQ